MTIPVLEPQEASRPVSHSLRIVLGLDTFQMGILRNMSVCDHIHLSWLPLLRLHQ
jgi:hypothetical protein